MSKALKCTECGMYYNSAVYTSCPHCKNGGAKKVAEESTKESEKKHNWFSGWIKKKTEETEEPEQQQINNVEPPTPALMPTPTPTPTVYMDPRPFNDVSEPNDKDADGPVIDVIDSTFTPVADSDKEKKDTPKKDNKTLSTEIMRRGRTIGKYISSTNGEEGVDPVVGWLICVKGEYFGQAFSLKSGKNKVGRSHEMDVKLLNDQSVSKKCVATFMFESRKCDFSVIPGESDSFCYVNGEPVYERLALNGYEELEFGDSGLNKFVFVPLCGERFSWNNYISNEKKQKA